MTLDANGLEAFVAHFDELRPLVELVAGSVIPKVESRYRAGCATRRAEERRGVRIRFNDAPPSKADKQHGYGIA